MYLPPLWRKIQVGVKSRGETTLGPLLRGGGGPREHGWTHRGRLRPPSRFLRSYGDGVKVGPAGPAHLSSGLLKMTDFSCGLILPKISQQPARQPVAGRLRIPAQNEAHLGAPSGDST
jgi:hypothetical protein